MISAARDLGPVLVTGAEGFLGTALVARLRAAGRQVTTTDLGGGDIACDITDFAQVEAVFRGRVFATIFHCGAVSGPMVLADQPLAIWRINALGTAHLLEAAHRHASGRVVVCSTTEVYGDTDGAVDEQTLPTPTSVYAASKLAAENAVLGYAREHGLDIVALRLSWIYGPGRRTPTMLEQVLRAALAGRPAAFDAAPDDVTHYLYVDDAVDGLLCAAGASALPERIYNITAGTGIPMRRIAQIIGQFRPGFQLSLAPPRPAGAGPSTIDARRARQDLGFHAATALDVGLSKYLSALAG